MFDYEENSKKKKNSKDDLSHTCFEQWNYNYISQN